MDIILLKLTTTIQQKCSTKRYHIFVRLSCRVLDVNGWEKRPKTIDDAIQMNLKLQQQMFQLHSKVYKVFKWSSSSCVTMLLLAFMVKGIDTPEIFMVHRGSCDGGRGCGLLLLHLWLSVRLSSVVRYNLKNYPDFSDNILEAWRNRATALFWFFSDFRAFFYPQRYKKPGTKRDSALIIYL